MLIKPYGSTSEIYKVQADGVVDKVYLDTSNQDGYEIRKCMVGSNEFLKLVINIVVLMIKLKY